VKLSPYLASLIQSNGLQDCTYIEPYAGGAGAALNLLAQGDIQAAFINDADPAIHAFWDVLLTDNDSLASMLESCDISVEEWRKQKEIISNYENYSKSELAFAALFLNRTSRSGILKGSGVIGGYAQEGEWRIDARFYQETITARIRAIADLSNRIEVSGEDALDFLRRIQNKVPANTLVYLDPPYYKKGRRLYQNDYGPSDHEEVASFVQNELKLPWVVSYDNVPEIKELYRERHSRQISLTYTASKRRQGQEVLFFSDDLKIPRLPKKLRN
jgi:DNA adenine methylase